MAPFPLLDMRSRRESLLAAPAEAYEKPEHMVGTVAWDEDRDIVDLVVVDHDFEQLISDPTRHPNVAAPLSVTSSNPLDRSDRMGSSVRSRAPRARGSGEPSATPSNLSHSPASLLNDFAESAVWIFLRWRLFPVVSHFLYSYVATLRYLMPSHRHIR